MSEEWSKWHKHDGNGCPLPVGTMCHRVFEGVVTGGIAEGLSEHISPVGPGEMGSWDGHPLCTQVIRYRIRQFKAMKDLKRLVEEPEKVPA